MTRSKPIAFFAEGLYWVNNHAHCIDSPDKLLLEYLCFYINAISLEKYVTGSAQPKMTQDNMNSILIPLPPYNEQKRLSQHLDEIMAMVDRIEIGKIESIELISKAKSKILDLAIRGQLVPQDPDDEPASVLLERIRAEIVRRLSTQKAVTTEATNALGEKVQMRLCSEPNKSADEIYERLKYKKMPFRKIKIPKSL